MNAFGLLKSGLRAAFFCWLLAGLHALADVGPSKAGKANQFTPTIVDLQKRALSTHLENSPKWAALIHTRENIPKINDSDFILSLDDFSPRNELLLTIAALYGSDSLSAVCKFPARYYFLQQEAGLPKLPLDQCTELNEFAARAPDTNISLVFASENIGQPSSMMGHLFLKYQGINERGVEVEHSISFFTDADTINLPVLLYESTVTGKKGFFALSPYENEIKQYVDKERRTLWEYELRLSEADRKLLRFHIQELRHAQITYFFQKYNCATLVEDMLAVIAPDILNEKEWWATPKSVVKQARQANIISAITVKTPARWMVRNIQDELPSEVIRKTQMAVETRTPSTIITENNPASTQNFMVLELARTYNAYLLEQQQISSEVWRATNSKIRQIQETSFPGLELQADPTKDPARSPNDKQVSAAWRHQSGRNYIKLGMLPVSHTLADDNSQSSSENELRLFDSALLIDGANRKVSLDHLTIYATQSLLPRDPMTGGLSGGVNIGFERQMSRTMTNAMAFLLEGNLGATWRPARDVDAFVLMGGGWGYHQRGYLYAKPTVGMLIREIYDMKSIISISQTTRPLGQSGAATEMRFTQAKYLDRQNTVTLEALRTRRSGQTVNRLDLSFKHLF